MPATGSASESEVQRPLEQREQEFASLQSTVRDQKEDLSLSQSRVQVLEREIQNASPPAVSSAPPSRSGAIASGADLPIARPSTRAVRTLR